MQTGARATPGRLAVARSHYGVAYDVNGLSTRWANAPILFCNAWTPDARPAANLSDRLHYHPRSELRTNDPIRGITVEARETVKSAGIKAAEAVYVGERGEVCTYIYFLFWPVPKYQPRTAAMITMITTVC